MFCRKCGKQIPDDSRFCQHCGKAVQVITGQVIEKTVKVTPEEINSGATISVELDETIKPLEIMLPKIIENGHVLRLKKVKMIDKDSGKALKKDVYLKISIVSSDKGTDR